MFDKVFRRQGWTSDPGRDAQLEYRLSIYHARYNDTGSYSCFLPNDRFHKIRVVVKDVRCPQIVATPGLRVSNPTAGQLNDEVRFFCDNGNSLISTAEVEEVSDEDLSAARCLPSGKWSRSTPACTDVVCPTESLIQHAPPALRVRVEGRGSGGRASFSCSAGHRLSGPTEAVCRPDGAWSVAAPPRCDPVRCPVVEAPEQGYLSRVDGGRIDPNDYRVGDGIRFHCRPGHMMEGHPLAECNAQGEWSRPPPTCVRACTFPGSIVGGRISTVRFFYRVGDSVDFECNGHAKASGAKRLVCMESGRWSSAVPRCVPEM